MILFLVSIVVCNFEQKIQIHLPIVLVFQLDAIPTRWGATSPNVEGVSATMPTFSDAEALIMIDVVFIKDRSGTKKELYEDVQIASIQFNNLDVVGGYNLNC